MAGSSGADIAGVAMKAISLSIAIDFVSRIALAQSPGDPMAQLRACSLVEPRERLQCFDELSRKLLPPDHAADVENWIVSETTSPVNYEAIGTAAAFSRGGPGSAVMQLSINCRGGRTELVVSGPAVPVAPADVTISYRVNDGPPVQLAPGIPSSKPGAAFTGDVVRLLNSLPDQGHIAVRISGRSGTANEGRFSLSGLQTVRERLAAVCKWPHAVARPPH
jgi:hypothetical protein